MSIAVRVSVWILVVLVILCAGVAVVALMQKQTLQQHNQSLQNQIDSDKKQLEDLTNQLKIWKPRRMGSTAKFPKHNKKKSRFKAS